MAGEDQGRERFADAFAGKFLVPGDELRRKIAESEAFDDLADLPAVVHLQRHFGVSFATLGVRLLQEELVLLVLALVFLSQALLDALNSPGQDRSELCGGSNCCVVLFYQRVTGRSRMRAPANLIKYKMEDIHVDKR